MITQTGLKNRHFWMITQTGLNWVSLRCTGFGLIGRRHLKSPGNRIFFLQTWEYIMFLNNKIIFLGIVFNDFYVIKHFLKLCGGWLRLPLLWRKSRQTLPRSNIEHTYVQVHSSPSLEFVCSKKVFILHFSGNVDQVDVTKQLKIGSVCKVVRSDFFAANTSSLENPEYTTHYDMKRKEGTWKT